MPICLWVAAQLGVLKDLNNQVSKWHDLSISSRGFVQATALQQPIYEMNDLRCPLFRDNTSMNTLILNLEADLFDNTKPPDFLFVFSTGWGYFLCWEIGLCSFG